MESILLTTNIILAVLLVIVILLQRSEGGALGLGVSQDNFTTSRTAGSFLTKFTSITAVFFIITSIALVSISHNEIKEVQSVIDTEKEIEQKKSLPQIPENQK
jgi:preprotein translocase subunit SecG